MTETCHLLAAGLAPDAAVAFVRSASLGGYDVFDLRPTHLPRIEERMEKYRALPMDLADASLVLAAEEIGTGDILSTDERDFGAYRWKHRRLFRNLLLP